MSPTLPLIVSAVLAQARVAPTRGVLLPGASIVGDDDATALETNPGALGFSAGSLALVAADLDDGGRQWGEGVGLFGNLRLGALSNALGAQFLNPPDAFAVADATKLTYALALRFGRDFGVGAGFHWFVSDEDRALDALFTTDVGVTVRPWSLLGLGLVVRDANTPRLGARFLERRYDFEIALRPLGTDRLELGGGAEVGEETGEATPRARLVIGLLRGVALRGDVVSDEADFDGDGFDERDWRGTASLGLDLDRVGVFGGAVFGRGRAGGADLPGGQALGWAAGVRVGEERYRPAPIVPKRVEVIALEEGATDRDVVRLLAYLRALEEDPDCAAVIVKPIGLDAGMATVEELRERIAGLRRAGKRVYAHLGEASARDLYLAMAADRVLIDPSGGVRLVGMRASVLYYKGTLDRLGVRADIVKIAEYKSAPEPLTRTEASDPAREMRESIVDDLYGRLVAAIARDRGLGSEAAVRALVDRGPFTAREAKEARLVDEILPPEEIEDWIEARHGACRFETPSERQPLRPHRWAHRPRIAVIHIEGDMVDGESRDLPGLGVKLAGGDTIARAIEEARDDPSIRAIVVRIASPGGVVGAADLIWRELIKARAQKPVVASMGDVAASGGYYAAAGASRVFASPSTLTGSIGIFYGKLDVGGLFGKLGVTHEATERGARAGMESTTRPYTDDERRALMEKLRELYGRFLEAVHRGRGMPTDAVDAVGRGRVWTGAQARARGLVDAEGGLIDAVAEAKRMAGMSPEVEVELVLLPEAAPSLADRVLEAILDPGALARLRAGGVLPAWLRANFPASLPASVLASPESPQARLDCDIRIE
ncbi:MAG: signal peptide peptidase SppA [Myxococcota bacterium]